MGNSQSTDNLEVLAPSRPGEWALHSRLSYCTILTNNYTQTLAEEYVTMRDPRITNTKNLEIYEYRRRQNHNLVGVYKVEQESSSYLCNGRDHIKVKTQRIPFRLSEIGSITFPEGIFILINSLMGYKTIYEFNGSSIIDEQMIGFTQDGRVKVWLSSNFAKNTPDSEAALKHQDERSNEKGMITQIFDFVKEHLEGKEYPEEFTNLYKQVSPNTFAQTLKFLEDYTKYASMTIPTSVPFREPDNPTSLSIIPSQINRGGSTLVKPPEPARVNKPLFSCGFINTSVNNNRFSQIPQGGENPSQISQKTETHKGTESRQSVDTFQKEGALKRNSGQQSVGSGPSLASNLPIASKQLVDNTTFTFKQLKTQEGSRNQTPSKQLIVSGGSHLTPIQNTPVQVYYQQQRPVSVSRPTSIYNSRSGDSLQKLPLGNNPYLLQNGNSPNQLREQKVLYHSPETRVNGIHGSRAKSPPAVVGSAGSVGSVNRITTMNRIQNIINRNSFANQTPIKTAFPSQAQFHNDFFVGQQHPVVHVTKQQPPYPEISRMPPKVQSAIESRYTYFPPQTTQYEYKSNIKQSFIPTDSVRPEIRKLMMTMIPPTVEPQIVVPPVQATEKPSEIKIQTVQSTITSAKSNLSQIKEIQIKNYLIGHSQVSPIRSFEEHRYHSLIDTPKDPPGFQYSLNTLSNKGSEIKENPIVVPEFKRKSLQQNPYEIYSFGERQMEMTSVQDARRMTPILRVFEVPKIERISEQQIGQTTLKIQELKNINSMPHVEQEDDIELLQALISNNLRMLQQSILNTLEWSQRQIDRESSKHSERVSDQLIRIPTYEQLRRDLLSQSLISKQEIFQAF